MKVKNIMFSGFAAAVLAGACGAADAATYTLASKDYVTNQLATKQNTLTAGDGIDITDDTISADLSTVTVAGADGTQVPVSDALTGLTQSVTAVEDKLGDLPEGTTVADALDEKQDTLTADQQAAVDSGITAEGVAEIESTATAVESLAGTVGDAESGLVKDVNDLQTSVATKADAQALTEGLALKEDVANKIASATAEQIEALSTEEKEAKYPSVSVAQTIANAAVTKVNEVAGDLSTLQTQVTTNTADIAGLKTDKQDKLTSDNAGENIAITTDADGKVTIASTYSYDDTELSNAVDSLETTVAGKADASTVTALSETVAGFTNAETGIAATYATKEALQAVSDVADAAQTESEVKNTVESYGYQTAEQVEAKIDAGKYLSDTMTEDGSYLVTKKGDAVSYASVSVIDGNGNVMTLQ